jgi:hypothetical protein
VTRGPNRGDAVGRRRGHGATPAPVLETQRPPVRVRNLGLRVAEDVVRKAQQRAKSFG